MYCMTKTDDGYWDYSPCPTPGWNMLDDILKPACDACTECGDDGDFECGRDTCIEDRNEDDFVCQEADWLYEELYALPEPTYKLPVLPNDPDDSEYISDDEVCRRLETCGLHPSVDTHNDLCTAAKKVMAKHPEARLIVPEHWPQNYFDDLLGEGEES